MIYLDSAATSLLKPRTVHMAVQNAMRTMASPGRGGHRPALLAAETAYDCRALLAELFSAPGPENVVFTMNATHALNIAISSLISSGDRVVVSGWEHNAVTRPLHLIGADIDVAASPLFNREATVDAFREKIPGAKAVVCTHVSNVFGFVLPIYEIAALCRKAGVPLIVDASQSAGLIEVDMAELGAEFICMPGHKGLMGPQGTGVLLCRESGQPLMAGGTGSESRSQTMPEFLPDRLEAGTHNIPGIAGLMAGAEYVRAHGADNIGAHEHSLMRRMARQLEGAGAWCLKPRRQLTGRCAFNQAREHRLRRARRRAWQKGSVRPGGTSLRSTGARNSWDTGYGNREIELFALQHAQGNRCSRAAAPTNCCMKSLSRCVNVVAISSRLLYNTMTNCRAPVLPRARA